MLRILALILFVMSSVCFAQAQEKTSAVKYAEFEKVTDGYVKMMMDGFYLELGNNPTAQGYIFNYGTDKEIALREKQILYPIKFSRYDASRITMVRAGFWKNPRTEMWVVPSGADNPSPSVLAEMSDEFGKVPDEELSARMDNFFNSLSDPNSNGFILNYGSAKVVLAMETRIKKYVLMRKLDLSKVTFKDAGLSAKGKTELWKIRTESENKKQ